MWKSPANIFFSKHFSLFFLLLIFMQFKKKRWRIIQWIRFLVEIQTKWDPCNPKHKVVSWCVIVKFQWHEWRFVTYIWAQNLVTHFFKAVQLSLVFFEAAVHETAAIFWGKKKKSKQHGTNEDFHILLLLRFYTSPLFYFFWNCSHLHHNILHDTKIIFSFSPKSCLVVNTSKSSSVWRKQCLSDTSWLKYVMIKD